MKAEYILIRYGELTTKGKNRRLFIKKLLDNIQQILKAFESLSYEATYDRIYIYLNGIDDKVVCEKLKKIFGIRSFSTAYKCSRDLDEAKKIVLTIVNDSSAETFKINTKRSDKTYPGSSLEINREIATFVFKQAKRDLKVDVHKPQLLITVEIRKDAIYIMDNNVLGAGGYPVGIGGQGMLMLSGGIDSPVAGYLMMKRGVDIEAIHFVSPPYTNELAKQKVIDLVDKLRIYSHGKIKLNLINFTRLQLAIYDNCEEKFAMTVMRRMMYRISEELASKHNCLILVNGESVGQVASQTLQSLKTINEVVSLPVIRPVACLDKLEIIDYAKKIDTFDISIRPHEDCCTIFTPKSPATKPKSYVIEKLEAKFNWGELVKECVDNVEEIIIDDNFMNQDFDDLF